MALILIHAAAHAARNGEKGALNLSIHPRNWGLKLKGFPRGEKVNTCSAPKPETKARLIAALREHCARHPHDMESGGRLAFLLGQD